MWKQFWDWVKGTLLLTYEVERLRKENSSLKDKLEENTNTLHAVIFELKRLSDTERLERQNLLLHVELQLERRLPRSDDPPPPDTPRP